MVSGGRLDHLAELFRDCSSSSREPFLTVPLSDPCPISGQLHPTPTWAGSPGSLAQLSPTNWRIFPGQGVGLLLLYDTSCPCSGLGTGLSSSATSEEPLCLLSRGWG